MLQETQSDRRSFGYCASFLKYLGNFGSKFVNGLSARLSMAPVVKISRRGRSWQAPCAKLGLLSRIEHSERRAHVDVVVGYPVAKDRADTLARKAPRSLPIRVLRFTGKHGDELEPAQQAALRALIS